MRRRRGFTLVEVLVALGLLVLVASLALPVALTNTARARATTAERMLSLAPSAARGEARRLGAPVALVLLPTEDGTEDGGPLRLAMVRQGDPQSDQPADLAADPDDVATWPTVDQPMDLPDGTRLWAGPADALADLEAEGLPLLESTLDDGAAGRDQLAAQPQAPVVLAWFLSDGSAVAGEATVLRLADGRIVRVRVEALVGRLVFTPAPELAEDAGDDPASQPDEPLAPGDEPPLDASGQPDDEGAPFDASASAGSFGERSFEPLGFEDRRFDELGFDEPEFDRLEFEELAFEDLAFDRPERERRDARDDEAADPSERTNPEPPQPR